MDYGKLGKRIKEERVKRHISREKMAEDMNISASYVGQIERGERCLTLDTLVHVSTYFQLSVDYLLRDSIEITNENSDDEWKRLTYGKTNEEKKNLVNILIAIDKYSDKN